MPDHWHALLWPQHPLLIEQVRNDAKKIMTLRLHARRGTQGPLWQHQFWDRLVRHEKEFAERLKYMHLNPVKIRTGEATGRLAVVQLQQPRFGQGHRSGLPHSD